MKKNQGPNIDKPGKQQTPGKRFTLMFVPDYSAQIRRLSAPYWALSLALVPVICIAVIIAAFQIRHRATVGEFQAAVSQYEKQAAETAQQLDGMREENSMLREILGSSESSLMQSEAEAEAARAQLMDFELRLAELIEKVDDINGFRQNLVELLIDINEQPGLEIPFVFDETVLTGSYDNALSRAGAGGINALLAEAGSQLSDNMLDLQTLGGFTQELWSYFRARPAGRPVRGSILGRDSEFGERTSPINGVETEMHLGIDISARFGAEISATADGVVTFSGWNDGGYGYLVVISHGYGYSTYYAHNSELLVSEGEEVKRGQVIALMGDSGEATVVHSHYEVRKNDIPQNPRLYIEG